MCQRSRYVFFGAGRGQQSMVRVDDGWSWRCEGCGHGGLAGDPRGDPAIVVIAGLMDRLELMRDAYDAGMKVGRALVTRCLRATKSNVPSEPT